MTKAENRAAAKAYRDEQLKRERDEQTAAAIAADLEQLRIMRHYFLRQRKIWQIDTTTLISLIDDYAERLTGNRQALHQQHHSIP